MSRVTDREGNFDGGDADRLRPARRGHRLGQQPGHRRRPDRLLRRHRHLWRRRHRHRDRRRRRERSSSPSTQNATTAAVDALIREPHLRQRLGRADGEPHADDHPHRRQRQRGDADPRRADRRRQSRSTASAGQLTRADLRRPRRRRRPRHGRRRRIDGDALTSSRTPARRPTRSSSSRPAPPIPSTASTSATTARRRWPTSTATATSTWSSATAGGTIAYFKNTGSPTSPVFTAQTGAANPFNGIDVGTGSAPAFADLDNDGDLDLVVGTAAAQLSYFENTGTRRRPAFTDSGPERQSLHRHRRRRHARRRASATSTATATSTWSVGEQDGAINYFENTGTATDPVFVQLTGDGRSVQRVWATSATTSSTACPTLVDLDADGDLDVVGGARQSFIHYLENIGVGKGSSAR